MRKPRVIIFDDENVILDILTLFMSERNYEVLTFNEPRVCPIYDKYCECCYKVPCADVIITDFKMPRMNGVELFQNQSQRGCKLDIRNKAVISGYIDDENKKRIEELGCAFFSKPFKLSELSDWLKECEARFDLSQPLYQLEKRKHMRYPHHDLIDYCSNNNREVFRGLTVDISESGMCLYSFQEHSVGQDIRIRSAIPVNASKATIRWIKNLRDTYCITGVMFV